MCRRYVLQLVVLCSVVLFVSELQAQITISEAQVQAILSPGKTWLSYVDSVSTSVNVGRAGGPNVYDFRSLAFVPLGRDTIFNTSQFPFLVARFPSTSIVIKSNSSEGSNFSVLEYSGGALWNPGGAFISPPTEFYRHSTPAERFNNLPITYNTQFSQTVTSTDSAYFNGIFVFASSSSATSTTVVDGYGTLLVPGGGSYNCLRIRATENPPSNGKEFRYFTVEGALVFVNSNNTQPDTGFVQTNGVDYNRGGSLSTAVDGPPVIPSEFSLAQNYPNPFNPSTTIQFVAPAAARVSIVITNLLGQEVASVAHGVYESGAHSVTWNAGNIPSGVYFYTLRATPLNNILGAFVETRKLVLLR